MLANAAKLRESKRTHLECSARPTLFVHPGRHAVGRDDAVIWTILGSCVAVCLWDATQRVGGLTHFVLPAGDDFDPKSSHRFGDHATPDLVRLVVRAGARAERIRARIFGGASLLDGAAIDRIHLGARNVVCAREALAALGVPIESEQVGGKVGQKILFRPADGAYRVDPIQRRRR